MNQDFWDYDLQIQRINLARGSKSFQEKWEELNRANPSSKIVRWVDSEGYEDIFVKVTPLNPANLVLTPSICAKLSRYLRWYSEWSGMTARQAWPFDDLSPASVYRILGGKKIEWTPETASRVLTYIAWTKGRDPHEIWNQATNSGTSMVLEKYGEPGGLIERVFPLNHTGENLAARLAAEERAGARSITHMRRIDLGLIPEEIRSAVHEGRTDIHAWHGLAFPNGEAEVRQFGRERGKHLLQGPVGGPSSRLFLMPLWSFNDFAKCDPLKIGSGWNPEQVRMCLENIADNFVAQELIQFGVYDDRDLVYPPGLKLSMWGVGSWVGISETDLDQQYDLRFFDYYHVVDNGRFELARPNHWATAQVYTAPGNARGNEVWCNQWDWLDALRGQLCHKPDWKSTQQFIHRFLKRGLVSMSPQGTSRPPIETTTKEQPASIKTDSANTETARAKGRARAVEFARKVKAGEI
jgi:hypothetical protein